MELGLVWQLTCALVELKLLWVCLEQRLLMLNVEGLMWMKFQSNLVRAGVDLEGLCGELELGEQGEYRLSWEVGLLGKLSESSMGLRLSASSDYHLRLHLSVG